MSPVYFINQKSQFRKCLEPYKALAKNESQQRIHSLRLDNEGKQLILKFCNFPKKHRIVADFSPPYAKCNAASEWLIQELWKMNHCMLLEARLPETLWEEAISHSIWLRNSVSSKGFGMNILFAKWNHSTPKLSKMLSFGTNGRIAIQTECHKR